MRGGGPVVGLRKREYVDGRAPCTAIAARSSSPGSSSGRSAGTGWPVHREGRGSGDNAAMESFFSLLQKNVHDCRSWVTHEELPIAIAWIERTYYRRRQAALGRLSPSKFETVTTTPTLQAA